MFSALNDRIVILSALGAITLVVYFNFMLNSHNQTPSNFQPPSKQHLEQANLDLKNGKALEQSGDLQEALKYYDKALILEPTNPDLLVAKGDAITESKNYTGAIMYYAKVLAANPHGRGSTDLIRSIGSDFSHLGEYSKAIKAYDVALTLRPNDPIREMLYLTWQTILAL